MSLARITLLASTGAVALALSACVSPPPAPVSAPVVEMPVAAAPAAARRPAAHQHGATGPATPQNDAPAAPARPAPAVEDELA